MAVVEKLDLIEMGKNLRKLMDFVKEVDKRMSPLDPFERKAIQYIQWRQGTSQRSIDGFKEFKTENPELSQIIEPLIEDFGDDAVVQYVEWKLDNRC